jgi:hypothetical protein
LEQLAARMRISDDELRILLAEEIQRRLEERERRNGS